MTVCKCEYEKHKSMCKPTCPTGEGESEWEGESGRGGGGEGAGADPLTSESSDDDFSPDFFDISTLARWWTERKQVRASRWRNSRLGNTFKLVLQKGKH